MESAGAWSKATRLRFVTWNLSRRVFLKHLAGVPAVALAGLSFAGSESGSEATLRRLRFTLRFENPYSRSLGRQRFWCYLPMSIASRQQLRQVDVSMQHRVLDDDLGHRILELTLDTVPPLAQKVVTVSIGIVVGEKPQAEALSQPSVWLSPERFIESDDALVREAAKGLRRDSQEATVRAIYEWVRDHLTYAGYLADDLGARYALENRRGDCTEYADLVVALARANGIPARMVGGYVLTQDAAPRPQDYHNWAEVFLGDGWRVVDAQKRNWLHAMSQYVAYRFYRDTVTNAVGLAHRYRLEGEIQVGF